MELARNIHRRCPRSLTTTALAALTGWLRCATTRRGFCDEWASHKSAIAKEALDRIGALFDIERTIAGAPPGIRRAVRQRTARPKIDATLLDHPVHAGIGTA